MDILKVNKEVIPMIYRIKDFMFMDVYNANGKCIGSVKDLSLNYYDEKVVGFVISPKGFSKKNYLPVENILSINGDLVVKHVIENKTLEFFQIKTMDILDKKGHMIGVVEDILVELESFSIKGLVVSTGFIDKILKGKHVILIKETILGEHNILFYGNEKLCLKSVPHNFIKRNE